MCGNQGGGEGDGRGQRIKNVIKKDHEIIGGGGERLQNSLLLMETIQIHSV
jgi:hypothetical protein